MIIDPENVAVNGLQLIAVIFGLTEFIKDNLNLSGKTVTILAALIGGILFALLRVSALLPAPWSQYYEIGVSTIAYGLTAAGYYKFLAARLPKQESLVISSQEPPG